MSSPLELNIEYQEMPPDGSKCEKCKEIIFGKMFQYFLFDSNCEMPMPTKFKYCETCYNG